MNRTKNAELELSRKLAALTGWRMFSKNPTGDGYLGTPPGKAGRMLVPNYFDPADAEARAELLGWIEKRDLQERTHFLSLLDAIRADGAWFGSINTGSTMTLEQAFAVLNAPGGVVAACLVEVFGLDEEIGMAVAA